MDTIIEISEDHYKFVYNTQNSLLICVCISTHFRSTFIASIISFLVRVGAEEVIYIHPGSACADPG